MEKAYYLHMRRLFPKMRLLFTDTDSVMVQIFELQDPLHAMAEANLNGAALFDVAGKAQDQGRAEEGGDQRPASRAPGGAGRRQRAQGGLRAAAQPRARDSRGDQRRSRSPPSMTRSTASMLATRGCWGTGATWSSCGCWALTLRQALRPSTS